MHLHILGICGTFMGGIACLAQQKGFRVTGSDRNVYPPMSTQLEKLGIQLHQGFNANQLIPAPDCVVVGNAMSRGMEVVESLLNSNQVFRSGPQWLNENILQDKWVIAVSGTHGKTSTASMVAWILEDLGYNPGFLIGGVLENFGLSARYTDSPFFVVEADEYDTAFFDKRSKFVHYRARTCVINNLEFDHADIFKDLEAIETQFHHLIRTIPQNGLVIAPTNSSAIDRVIKQGSWTPIQYFTSENTNDAMWQARKINSDGSEFEVIFNHSLQAVVKWNLIGDHNVNNALAAIAAAHHVGVSIQDAISALSKFKNVKRRMELKGTVNGVELYDDFAHHPTAIETTLAGLRRKSPKKRIFAIVDLRSNTMKSGFHRDTLVNAVQLADHCIFHLPEELTWEMNMANHPDCRLIQSTEMIIQHLLAEIKQGDCILVMSNGGFDGIHEKLLTGLGQKWRIDGSIRES